MKIAILYGVTLVLFLGADVVGLKTLIRPVFEKDIGHLLLKELRIGAALAFYLFYIAGVVWFVSYPAVLNGKGLVAVFLLGGFIGALAYGTYEFTNLATLKDWTVRMVIVDLSWGIALTGFAAAGGVAVTRMIST